MLFAGRKSPEIEEKLRNNGIGVFSVLRSSQTLLQAMIEIPNVMEILTDSETSLYEITLFNSEYEGMTLREFPFTGDVIFVRIFRGKDSIVPHGETELNLYDRLIVTGTKEYVEELKQELSICQLSKILILFSRGLSTSIVSGELKKIGLN